MDFLHRLKEYIEGLSFTPSTVNIGLYNENRNSMAIVPSPSNIDTRYMEKSKIYPFSFQILVHFNENFKAYDITNELMVALENISGDDIRSSDESFKVITMQCTTTPNFVQKTYHGTLWTAIFMAELYVKGGK